MRYFSIAVFPPELAQYNIPLNWDALDNFLWVETQSKSKKMCLFHCNTNTLDISRISDGSIGVGEGDSFRLK